MVEAIGRTFRSYLSVKADDDAVTIGPGIAEIRFEGDGGVQPGDRYLSFKIYTYSDLIPAFHRMRCFLVLKSTLILLGPSHCQFCPPTSLSPIASSPSFT